MSATEKMVKIGWYCGYSVKWNGFFTEPDECSTEFETIETLEDWQDGAIYATCPSCGAELNLEDDHPQVLEVFDA